MSYSFIAVKGAVTWITAKNNKKYIFSINVIILLNSGEPQFVAEVPAQVWYCEHQTTAATLNYIIYTKLTATSPTTTITTNYTNCTKLNFPNYTKLHFNLPTMATLGTEESGHYKEAAIVEKFIPELIYGLFASRDKKSGHCGEMAKSGGSSLC